ncbi:nucleoside/nucleotide kinase family protein [Actinoplanes sp. OR16]|uniref:nucleoside/nucleotide kinase family protein n=1 Tax=Actinoplanes sp. OR16 TaxID=946334 RepID=UPI000F6BC6C2|nr:nucleoside/nucleotide kinase family protein [Actinoplanes sp. OR16]BBH70492.1 nucleoside/nucleotide kinase family protein [Actinoplanes sp. OR16]
MTLTLPDLAARAAGLVRDGRRAVLGIAGPPGAGKTTLATSIVASLRRPDWVAHVPMDGFHLADVELERLGLRDRKGAPETFDSYGYAALLRRLLEDRDPVVYAPGFERVLEQPLAGVIGVPSSVRLIVTEGNYLLVDDPAWRPVRELLTEVWYADLGQEERLERLVERHVRFGKSREDAVAWATGTDEANATLIAATRARADLVVPPL